MRDAQEEAAAIVGAFWTLGPVPVVVVDTVTVPGSGIIGRTHAKTESCGGWRRTGQKCIGNRSSSRFGAIQ